MKVDTTTPEGFVRALVMSSNKTTESRTLVIRRAEFVCDRSVRIAAPVGKIKTVFTFLYFYCPFESLLRMCLGMWKAIPNIRNNNS